MKFINCVLCLVSPQEQRKSWSGPYYFPTRIRVSIDVNDCRGLSFSYNIAKKK